MALLNIVPYEAGLAQSVALDQMHLLSLTLAGRSAKDLTEFVRKANSSYVLHGLKQTDLPAPAMLFQSLFGSGNRSRGCPGLQV